MSRFNVTAAAASRFRDMIAEDAHGRDVVVLRWEEPKVNNLRGLNGEVQWVREANGRLLFDLASEQELADRSESVEIVSGLKFFVVERVHTNRLDGRTIDYTSNGFAVG
jgi:hypothetical protein